MSDNIDRINEINTFMDADISPTFCLAKWHHTTIYLHRGQTHSCYHPPPHNIPVDELKYNPSALHNTRQKIEERIEMLNGDKPSGCQYCWNVEAMGDDYISDRKIRNASIYTEERYKEILNNPPDFKINPEYIEIAFSSECNFKCGYCHPMHSSSFYNEIKKHGPVPNVKNHSCDIDWFTNFDDEDANPYIKAWWQWWPEVSKTLNILRITGGEPLLHKTTWRLFEELTAEPKPHLEINMNSNLGMTSRHVEKLAQHVKHLTENDKIRRFKLFTSIDCWGPGVEYLRTGMDRDLWEKNMDIYIRGVQSHITHMCTFNVLSVATFKDYLAKVLEWREKYNDIIPDGLGSADNVRKIRFDTPYLKEPIQYDMHILPKEKFMHYFDECLQFIRDNLDEDDVTKFCELEYERFRRVRDYFESVQYDDAKVRLGRRDFYHWFTEYDKRRGTNFLETFPEYSEFWDMCKEVAESEISVVNIVG